MSFFIDEFQADLEALPNILQKKYALMRDLDKSLQEIVRQNEQRCEQEIEDMKRGLRAGNITPDTSLLRFSEEALDEQKHSVRIADEKVALAIQAYDLVDSHIQQLDQYLKKSGEELRRERENTATASPTQTPDGTTKSGRSGESGRGGRKKYAPIIHKLVRFPFMLFNGHPFWIHASRNAPLISTVTSFYYIYMQNVLLDT
uniref:Inhibitor of growth protein N-terminal histone-binding domain-containing protein n=1 Tax=Gossypium raimondii TaxID=29730 RepID=A0A0D2N750_GOSRA|nr:hypothetical protein B456_005G039000 [Gossypium raimondii]